MATIYPNGDFDPEAAATALKDAMDGLGTNESAIIKVLASNSCAQRLEIADYYKTAYGADLIEDLKSEIGGDFEQTVVAMLAAPRVYDARELHRAIAGGGTDEECLIEILVSRSNEEIAEIKEAYTAEFEASLEEDLDGDTGGNFQRLLISMANGTREDDHDQDNDKAMEDAQAIFDAGEGQCGTDESEFNKVLCLRGRRQLYAMMSAYANIAGKSLEDVIDSETSGSIHDGYMSIVKHCRYPASYFAGRIHAAIAGAGTNDDTLIRIIVSRSELDLKRIDECYVEAYEKSLHEAVSGDCGGDYKRMLLAIIRVKHCQYPASYFAGRIHAAIAGGGTNDDTLIRIIVSRSESDLKKIDECYVEAYEKSLYEAVSGDCGGDYKRLLLAIIRGGADEE